MPTCPVCNQELAEGDGSCPSCGFHVLGATEEFSPIGAPATPTATIKPVRLNRKLRIVRGPQTGIDLAIKDGVMTVGRDPHCDIFLNDMTVSRSHAEIEVGPKGCIIRDKGSVNGVWVNDRMIEACSLKPGDLLQIGAFCLSYSESLA